MLAVGVFLLLVPAVSGLAGTINRAGFREVPQKEGWMYITAGMPRGLVMTHEEALAAPLSVATPLAPTRPALRESQHVRRLRR